VIASTPLASRGPISYLYGIYCWLAFLGCIFIAILAAVLVPGLERRRRYVAACSRTVFRLAGVRVNVRGYENLPTEPCIVVANHASIVDGVLLQGFLPAHFSFVIKAEMQRFPAVSFLMRRVGSRFVERFETTASARDARDLLRAASAGESLTFFAEGTVISEPGLNRFRAGAFVAAIKASIPIVPLSISGSRHILAAHTLLPRHGHLRIDILNPVEPSHRAFASSRDLAELARQRILEVLDEPDLLAEKKTRKVPR